MPFIDSKISCSVSSEKEEVLKSELGKLISTIPGKSENFLMVGFNPDYSLFFGGKKLDKGAFVEVKLLGSAPAAALDTLTGQICALYEKELGIPQNCIYVKYEFVEHWGWNGHNF